jgi:hypothetical protein
MVAWTGNYASINGHILDGVEPDGTKWGIVDVEGLGSTDPTLDIVQRTRRSGGVGGDSFGGPRTVSLSGWLTVPSPAMLSHAIDRLIAAVSRQPVPFVFVEENRARSMTVQRSDSVLARKVNRRYAEWSIQVKSKDWRKFSPSLSGSTHLPATSGGLVIPFTVPLSIDSSVASGQVNLVNDGNEVGPVFARLDGPVTGPIIRDSSGAVLSFVPELVITAGNWLVIDMERRSVLANGQASRSGYLQSRGWSSFRPGLNTWSFSAAEFSADALLTITATPADE